MFHPKKKSNYLAGEKMNQSRIYLQEKLHAIGISDTSLQILSDTELTDLLNGLKALTRQDRANTTHPIESWQAQIGHDKTSYC